MFRHRRRQGASIRVVHEAPPWKAVWGRRLRWSGMVLVMVGIAAGLHAAGQKMLDPRLFPLRHVHIEGELRNLNAIDVENLVQDYLGQNFFALDVRALQAGFAVHPWIERVTVRRQWPDSLVVRFRERIAFARWGQQEMVDVNGQRFHPTVIRQSGSWPQLRGPQGHEMTLIQVYKEADAMVAKTGLQITNLVQDGRRAWWMRLDNGIEIDLGRERFIQRLQRFVDVYPRALADRVDQIAAVDLRYANGFAVRWNQSSDTQEEGRLAGRKSATDAMARKTPHKIRSASTAG